jgi:hypothetical protein
VPDRAVARAIKENEKEKFMAPLLGEAGAPDLLDTFAWILLQ